MLKKIIYLLLSTIQTDLIMAQHYNAERTYDIVGLADGDEIVEALKNGIPLILTGLLIAYIFLWINSKKKEKYNITYHIGCFGFILIGAGVLYLIPLIAWIEYFIVSIISIVFIIGIVILIIYHIWEKLTK